VRCPAKIGGSAGLLRTFLRKPRVFDLVSCILQLRDLKRLALIRDNSPADAFYEKVADYNAGVTQSKVVSTTRRAELLYQVLALPPRDLSTEKLLIVGPRNIQELFIAWLYGYKWENIQGIDLYSTNEKIIVMNMEDVSFPNDSYDAIVMSHTLAYAKDTFRCLSEVARVLKPSGRFVFGATYFPQSTQWPGNLVSGSEIRSMLKTLGLDLAYYQAIDRINSLGGAQTVHIFGVQKKDPRGDHFDRVDWL
jgi:SAM-dependent methyltransferase